MVVLATSEFIAAVRGFADRLASERVALDALNVFPVADADTGTNMLRSVDAIVAALDSAVDVGAPGELARVVEDAALEGRGNSGLIIGQFLAGFASVEAAGEIELTRAAAGGAERARRAVAEPVEGTMLTVADAAASALRELPDLPPDALLSCVRGAVAATPTQLPILAERGVVDSGAAGLQLLFEALVVAVESNTSTTPRTVGEPAASVPTLIRCDVGNSGRHEVGSANEVGHEVQFRVPRGVVDDHELRSLLERLGRAVVVVQSASELAAHVHVADASSAVAVISAELEGRLGAKAISYDVEPLLEQTNEVGS